MVLINELATVHGDMWDVTKTSKNEKKMREQKEMLCVFAKSGCVVTFMNIETINFTLVVDGF